MRQLGPLAVNFPGSLAPRLRVTWGCRSQHSGSCYPLAKTCEARPGPPAGVGAEPSYTASPAPACRLRAFHPVSRARPSPQDWALVHSWEESPGLRAKTCIPAPFPWQITPASQTPEGLRARGLSKPPHADYQLLLTFPRVPAARALPCRGLTSSLKWAGADGQVSMQEVLLLFFLLFLNVP